MTDFDTTALETAVTDCTELEPRDARALTEYMTSLPLGGGIYSVTTQSESEYRVDVREGCCTCPDYKHNLDGDGECKHLRRVAFATGDRALPAWVNVEAVDPQLGLHVDGSPSIATTDGGTLADVDAEDDEGDDECLCDTTDLGCFEHFEVTDG